jgi:hypothetical protein
MPEKITIAVTPAPYSRAWAVEETVPEGWLVSGVSDGGRWDEQAGQVRWGPLAVTRNGPAREALVSAEPALRRIRSRVKQASSGGGRAPGPPVRSGV